MRVWWSRLVGFIRGAHLEQELSEEVRTHLELAAEEHRSNGMSEREAAAAALRDFGRLEQIREEVRDQRGIPFFEALIREVRYAARGILRQRMFALASILTMGIGISATITVFSLSDALLNRAPAGVQDPGRVVGATLSEGTSLENPNRIQLFAPPQVYALDEIDGPFLAVAGYNRIPAVANLPERAVPVNLEMGSGSYFTLLGIRPALGRILLPEDDQDGVPPVVMLSYDFWQTHFGGSPDVLGQTIDMIDKPFRIVGVAPRGYSGNYLNWFGPPDLWIPWYARYASVVTPRTGGVPLRIRQNFFIRASIVARLRPGISMEAAEAELEALLQRPELEDPNRDTLSGIRLLRLAETQLWPDLYNTVGLFLAGLGSVAVLILLAACFNVANFLLGRGASRRKELAVRMAIGATRKRIVGHLLTETLLLVACAGGLGIMLSAFLLGILRTLPSVFLGVPLDGGTPYHPKVVGFALLITAAVAVIVGLFPALLSSPRSPFREIKGRKPGWSWVGFHITPRQVLLTLQVGLATVLAIAAGLYITSLQRVAALDPGYSTGPVLLAEVNTLALSITPGFRANEESNVFYEQLYPALRAQSEVIGASAGWAPFVTGPGLLSLPEDPNVDFEIGLNAADTEFFKTHDVRLLAGREFDGSTRDYESSVIINNVLAETLWPGENAINRSVLMASGPQPRFTEELRHVVGVVSMEKCDLFRPPHGCVWIPFPRVLGQLRVRTTGDPMAFVPVLERIARSINPKVALSNFTTEDEFLGQIFPELRVAATASTILAAVGIFLAALGCWSLFASMVKESLREIAIRLALGVDRWVLVRTIVVRAAVIGSLGIAVGLAAVSFVTRFIEASLGETSIADPTAISSVVVLMLLVTLAACCWPARTATRTDPARVLRQE